MPYKLRKVKRGYRVTGRRGRVHAYRASKRNAKAQLRLLRGIEHGWTPTRRRTNPVNYDVILRGAKVEWSLGGGRYAVLNRAEIHYRHNDLFLTAVENGKSYLVPKSANITLKNKRVRL